MVINMDWNLHVPNLEIQVITKKNIIYIKPFNDYFF